MVVAATGTVNPVVSVQVGSQLSGQIRELLADFNTVVQAGQPIARLDTATLEARRAAALADLQAAKAGVVVARAQAERAMADRDQAGAQLEAARAAVAAAFAGLRDAEGEARRAAELRSRGVGAERDALRTGFAAERAAAELAGARANVLQQDAAQVAAEAAARTAAGQAVAAEAAREQRVAQLRQVEVDIRLATIRSPIDGIIVSRNVDLGQTVAASFQAPVLFQIAASLDEMEVHATVDEADIGRIRPGQAVSFTIAAHPGETLAGHVKDIRLATQVVQNVVTYTVVVAAPNADGRLLPGMTATLRIVTEARAEVLRVPNAALRWRPPGSAALGNDPVAQALAALPDLTAAQRAEIAAAEAELAGRLGTLPQDAEARRVQAQAARARLAARLNAALTPDQRARLATQHGAAAQVWVLAAGEAVPRPVPVRAGLSDGSMTEILAGDLPAAARVVVGQARGAGAIPAGREAF